VAFGKRPRVRFILKRTPAEKLKFGEDMIGGGRGVNRLETRIVVFVHHRELPSSGAAPIAAFAGVESPRAGRAGILALPRGLDDRVRAILSVAMQRWRSRRRKIARSRPLPARPARGPIAL